MIFAPIPGFLLRVTLLAAVSALPKQGAPDINDVVRRAVANYERREALRSDYTYVVRMRCFIPRTPRPHFVDRYEVMFLEGAPYTKHVAHDDRPLPPDQQKYEEALLEAEARSRRAGTGHNAGGLWRPLGSKMTWTLDRLTDEFTFHRKGTEIVDGRRVTVIEAVPKGKPDLSKSNQDYARYFKATLWIDASELQIVRVKEELIEDGLTLIQPTLATTYPIGPEGPQILESGKSTATCLRGNVYIMQWTKIADDVWLPRKSYTKEKTRVVRETATGEVQSPILLEEEIETIYSDYKKFSVKTRIVQ